MQNHQKTTESINLDEVDRELVNLALIKPDKIISQPVKPMERQDEST
ncbi:MAG: hypothetical protein OEV78_11615 [Spirochaetia bacterium]|nr:hypothetical protein [Spirochaetia bacterium]